MIEYRLLQKVFNVLNELYRHLLEDVVFQYNDIYVKEILKSKKI